MDTLVICIDRDNDLGEKAKVITPIVGRGANIAAAVSLATVDPEDSDTNTIFGGIRILDELRSLGVDAEIVSFAGDKNVGTISDKKIADQLDEFLASQDVKSAIFVSDGAEDESLIPLIQSRVKVDSVQRIVVMQSKNLESTYYMIKNFLKEPKLLQPVLVPVGLALIIYAMAMATNNPELAIIGTFLAVGTYMILRAYALNDRLILAWTDLKKSFYSHQLSFVTTVTSLLLFIVGTISGVISVWSLTGGATGYFGLALVLSLFIKNSILWYSGSAFIYLLGKIFDKIHAKREYQNLIVDMLFVLSGTLLLWSAGSYTLSLTAPDTTYTFELAYFIYSIILAVIIGLTGIYFSVQKKENETKEEILKAPIEAENETKNETEKKTEKVIVVRGENDDDRQASKPVKIKVGIRNKKD